MKYSTESNLFRNNSEKKDKKKPIQKKLYKNTFKSCHSPQATKGGPG